MHVFAPELRLPADFRPFAEEGGELDGVSGADVVRHHPVEKGAEVAVGAEVEGEGVVRVHRSVPESFEKGALAWVVVGGNWLLAWAGDFVLDAPSRPFAEGVVGPVPSVFIEE